MSDTTKLKVNLTLLWAIFVTMIGGVIQAGRVLERLDALPQIQQEIRAQGKRVDAIEEALRRNHIVSKTIEQLTTASYE